MPWSHALAQGFVFFTRPNSACMFFSSMNIKRFAFSEHFLSHRRKMFAGFSLVVAASLLIISLFFLSNSLVRIPKVEVFVPGFDTVCTNSSFSSCPFSFNSNHSSYSSGTNVSDASGSVVVSRTGEVNASQDGYMKAMQEGMRLEKKTLLVNSTENGNNATLHAGEQRYAQKSDGKNGALVTDKGNLYDSNGEGLVSRKTGVENSPRIAKGVDFHDGGRRVAKNTSISGEGKNMATHKTIEGESLKNSGFSPNMGSENKNRSNSSYNGKRGMEKKHEGDLIEKNNVAVIHGDSQQQKMRPGFHGNCDIFDGKWVRDDSKPYYPLGSCPLIERDFDCHLNRRPDSEYVKWKWQPNGCDVPSLNATDFLERLRGQRLVFVGDSLNRNMWESLVCILRQSIRDKKRVFEISGKKEFKKKGVYAFRFEDYNCSVDFVVSPFIVRESTFKGKNGSFETLRLDLMDPTTTRYKDADIIVFNTGHWWTHEKTSKGEDYYQEGKHVYPRLKVLDAYTRALTTWAKWVDRNIDPNQTRVFFRGYSITHFWGGQWNSGGQCHKETEPIFNESYLQKYPSKMRAVEHVIQKMKTPVVYMNITKLTDYRKDGHPSIYRKEYKTSAEQNTVALYEDCSHWCLPGVPDTWNELLYVSLLKDGKRTWKS